MSSGAAWVKVSTSIWGSDSIKLIRKMPDGDAILVIWFQLLTQAGKCNADGRLQMTDYIPMDADMLADLFDRPQELIERALTVFERFGMIEYDDDFPILPNWYKYQSVDALEKIRSSGAKRQKVWREKQKEAKNNVTSVTDNNVTGVTDSNVTSRDGVTDIRNRIKNKELELKDIKPLSDDKPSDVPADPIPYAEIVEHLNKNWGVQYKANSKKTKELIKTRWNEGFRVEDFKRVIDNMISIWNKEPRPGEKDMREYIRPTTLFSPKFEGYLNAKPPRGGGQGGGSNAGQQGNKASSDYSEFMD